MGIMKTGPVKHARIRHHRLRGVGILSGITLLSLLSYWYLFLRPVVESEDAYVTGNIIPVQALTPGIVSDVLVEDTLPVQRGQLLVKEEHNLSQLRLLKAESALAQAVRSTSGLFHQVEMEHAEIAALQAKQERLTHDLARYRSAEPSGAVSAQLVSDTQNELDELNRTLDKAAARLLKAQALVTGTSLQNNPFVAKAKAEFMEAHIENQRANIYSPVDGYISNRQVQAGEQIKTGQRLMAIVPLDDLWITANIKETRLAGVRTGETVEIISHTYGEDHAYHGKVLGLDPSGGSTFSLFPPNNATGNYIHIVERIPVRISLSKSELIHHPLRPGMSVKVKIDTSHPGEFQTLDSAVVLTDPSYTTTLYGKEVEIAQEAADKIIRGNL